MRDGRVIACMLMCGSWIALGSEPAVDALRIYDGLQALYDFAPAGGSLVEDRSGIDPPLNLRIADPRVAHYSADGLTLTGPTMIHCQKPATRLIAAIQRSEAVTIEAWIRPAAINQNGPARIVTLSRNASERNFTVGQDGDKVEVRLRTTATSTNGMPAVLSKPKSLVAEWTHLLYTRDRAGRACIYLNGKPSVEQVIGGSVSNWEGAYALAIANELSGDRPWLGTYRLVAVYSRDLAPAEVQQNFRAGTGVAPLSAVERLAVKRTANARLFSTQVAPLLSKYCLECHDSLTSRGQLDLSRKSSALAGGESGVAIIAGPASNSLLWRRVESDEMPHERDPLTISEKNLLRQWLEDGAAWSLDVIDPAVYEHGGGSDKVFVQRLTRPEYIETVRSVLGVDISQQARELLPRDLRADGFSNTAYNLNVDLGHIEGYARLAEIIAAQIDIGSLARRYTRSRELTDENVTKVVEPVGRQLLRGPLTKQEVAAYCGISTTVAGTGGNFDEALRYILQAMLQSPRFLYRIEDQQGDGRTRPVSQYELASRLSYIVWGGPPDDLLLQAAEKGSLDRAGVVSQMRRMLSDPRARARSRQFIAEWLNLDHLDNLRPGTQRFPHWNASLAADMREETLAFFDEIVWKQGRPLTDLLNAQVTFVTPRLAKHYRLPIDAPPAGDGVFRYDLSSVPGRSGLLTQGSILTVGGDDASMVARGLFMLHELLRGVVRDPPPCVDTTPVPSRPGLTQRAVAELRMANSNCTGCHSKFEPLAFALERFDGLGTYREQDEHGNKLREDGSILFPGEKQPLAYASAAELMDLLAASDRVAESLTWKVTQFALGRPLGAEDAPSVAKIHHEARQGRGTYASLMTAIVLSDLVRMTRTEVADESSPDRKTGP